MATHCYFRNFSWEDMVHGLPCGNCDHIFCKDRLEAEKAPVVAFRLGDHCVLYADTDPGDKHFANRPQSGLYLILPDIHYGICHCIGIDF